MKNGSRRTLLLFFLLTIVFVLGLTGTLNVSDFHRNYTESVISSFELTGRESVRKLEYALRYGKPLENFFGIEEILEELKGHIPGVSSVRLVTAEGDVLYDTGDTERGAYLPPDLLEYLYLSGRSEGPGFDETAPGYCYTLSDGSYHLFIPVRDGDATWRGSLQVIFPAEAVSVKTTAYAGKVLLYLLILASATMAALFFLSGKFPLFNEDGTLKKKTFLLVTLLLLGLVQVVFGWLNHGASSRGYMDVARENTALVSRIVKSDIESVIAKGVRYDQLYLLEDYLSRIAEGVPEVAAIRLSVNGGGLVYSSKAAAGTQNLEMPAGSDQDAFSGRVISLAEDRTGSGADLQVLLSGAYFAERTRAILLDSLTMVVLSIILMTEIVFFMMLIMHWQYSKKLRSGPGQARESRPVLGSWVVRPLSMLIGTSVFMSASFIPLRMKELYQPILGLSENIVLGLPISVEMLFAAVASFLAGRMSDRKGWQAAFFTGFAACSAGLFLSYYATQAPMFILARALTGAGYGFIIIAVRYFINDNPFEKERTRGFYSYITGLYAGFIIGVAVGAMLADRIGFAQVFLVSLAVSFLAALFVVVFMRPAAGPAGNTPGTGEPAALPFPGTKGDQAKGVSALSFLKNASVLGFFLLILLPLTICSMFVDYFFPIFAAGEGVSTSNIGRAFMLNGIAIAYLGPVLSTITQRRLSARQSVFVSGLVISAALVLFYFFGSVQMAFLVVIMMGVSESFGFVAQNNYFINLRATEEFGKGAALGYAENARKLGQMAGPLVFGSTLALGSLGIGLIGILTLAVTCLFLFRSREA